jgi:8-oxo-dGTP diphosphatase
MKDTNVVAVALIKNDKGEVLLIQQKAKDFGKYTDAWYPPAGHVKNTETVKEALVRELKEELNLEIIPIRLISVLPQDIKDEVAQWWECKIVSGDIAFNDGAIADYQYFAPDEIKDLKLWPATEKFFKKYIWK